MVNLRYHIVSITAVFLALGIGLLFGTAFIDRATVEILERNLRAAEQENEGLQRDLSRERAQVAAATEADRGLREQALSQLVSGRLDGVPVVVLAPRGIDDADVTAVTAEVVAAGADFGGVLWFTDRLLLDEEAEVADLTTALRLSQSDPVRLRASLARRLGTLLAGAAETPVDDAAEPGEDLPSETAEDISEPVPEPTLLAALRLTGFVEHEPPPEPPPGFAVIPDAGLRVVVVSGRGAPVPDSEFLVPLVERLTRDTVPQGGGPVVVAAQRGPDPDAERTDEFDPAAERVRFVGRFRSVEGLRDRLSTVDNLESFPGLLAVVLALEHGAAGQFGHYGVGEGAQGLLPAPAPALPADGG